MNNNNNKETRNNQEWEEFCANIDAKIEKEREQAKKAIAEQKRCNCTSCKELLPIWEPEDPLDFYNEPEVHVYAWYAGNPYCLRCFFRCFNKISIPEYDDIYEEKIGFRECNCFQTYFVRRSKGIKRFMLNLTRQKKMKKELGQILADLVD